MSASDYRMIVYSSRSAGGHGREDLPSILASSRRNNGIDGVSGLLWTDGDRYVQLLEGPPDSVALTFERIRRDARHDRVEVIEDGRSGERVFGDWSMANLPDGTDAEDRERLALALRHAPARVRSAFGTD